MNQVFVINIISECLNVLNESEDTSEGEKGSVEINQWIL